MSICGIYKITHKPSGKMYIGQSIDILTRWKEHIRAKDDSKFHKALRNSRITDFAFEILEECNQTELDTREQYWINYYNSVITGYNMTIGGNSGVLPSLNQNTKQVAQYSLDGHLITTYASVKEAQRITKVAKIADCCRRERLTAGGFQWRYYDINPLDFIEAIKAPASTPKDIVQYSMSGTKIRNYSSIAEASRITGITASNISSVCSGKLYSAGGFRWSYSNESLSNYQPTSGSKKAVLQFDLNGNFMARYESISAAARAVNGSVSSIAAACKGQLKTSKKSIWKYEL